MSCGAFGCRVKVRDFGEQGVALDVAMGAETSGDAVEVAVVVCRWRRARSALGWNGMQDFVEGFCCRVAVAEMPMVASVVRTCWLWI